MGTGTRDNAKQDVRIDMSSVPDAVARDLIGQYEPLVRRMAFGFRYADAEELEAVGTIGIIEAFVTYRDRYGVPRKQWTAHIIRQRMVGVMQRARRLADHELVTDDEHLTNGRHDPEVLTLQAELMYAVAELSPRHQAVISARIRGRTLEEIADQLGITLQRVHQEEKAAVLRLREITQLDV